MSASQPDLFTWRPTRPPRKPREPVPFAAGSETSEAAARKVRPQALAEQVYAFIASRPEGATDDECYQAFPDILPSTVCARRNGLARAGRIVRTGERRLTRRGNLADVWATAV